MKHLARWHYFIVFYICDILLVVSFIPKPVYFRVLSKVYDYHSDKWLSLIVIDKDDIQIRQRLNIVHRYNNSVQSGVYHALENSQALNCTQTIFRL